MYVQTRLFFFLINYKTILALQTLFIKQSKKKNQFWLICLACKVSESVSEGMSSENVCKNSRKDNFRRQHCF